MNRGDGLPFTDNKTRRHRSEGTQSIGRAIAVLKQIAKADKNGVRLVDVAAAMDLKTPTALRLLKALVAEGLARFDPKSKTYVIGTEFLALSAIANNLSMQNETLTPVIANLAAALGDTVYLMVRSGNESFCTAVIDGRKPIRINTLKVGDIRPLGVGSASLAILAFLDQRERKEVLDQNEPRFAGYGLNRKQIEGGIAEALRAGYTFNPGLLIPGVYGIGFPVLHGNKLVAGVGVMAVKDELKPRRRREIAQLFHESVDRTSGFSGIPPFQGAQATEQFSPESVD